MELSCRYHHHCRHIVTLTHAGARFNQAKELPMTAEICQTRLPDLLLQQNRKLPLPTRRALVALLSLLPAAPLLWKERDALSEETPANRAAAATTSDADSTGLLDGLVKLFDPNETTKSGKVLPKSYLKSAREVVKSLQQSLQQESTEEREVRRSADSAKEAIRDYLQNWRGQKMVESEESYAALESAIRTLGQFYRKEGPRAVLPSDVKSQIMEYLNQADAAL